MTVFWSCGGSRGAGELFGVAEDFFRSDNGGFLRWSAEVFLTIAKGFGPRRARGAAAPSASPAPAPRQGVPVVSKQDSRGSGRDAGFG